MKGIYRSYLAITSALIVFHVLYSQLYVDRCFLNRGISLGILPLATNDVVIVAGFVGLLAILSIVKVLRTSQSYARTTVLLMLGAVAGLSNLVDRAAHGGVCDYLWLRIGDDLLHFNFNDAILLVNGAFVIYLLLFRNANRG